MILIVRTYPQVWASLCSIGQELPRRPQEGGCLFSSVLIRSGGLCWRAGRRTLLSKTVPQSTFPVSCSTPKPIPCTVGGHSDIWPWRGECVNWFLWFLCNEAFRIDPPCLTFYPTISQTLFSATFRPSKYASSCISQTYLLRCCIWILQMESSVQKYHWGWWRQTSIHWNFLLVPSRLIYLFFHQENVLSTFLNSIKRRAIFWWHCDSFASPTQPNPVQISTVCSSSWRVASDPCRFVEVCSYWGEM